MELLNNMLARQQQFIQNLEAASNRIQNKTYGICSVTGQLIDKKRLMLVPHATKSMEAKTKVPAAAERVAEYNEKIAERGQNGYPNGKLWEEDDASEKEDAPSTGKSHGR